MTRKSLARDRTEDSRRELSAARRGSERRRRRGAGRGALTLLLLVTLAAAATRASALAEPQPGGSGTRTDALPASSVPAIVGEIGKLEQARDPKCYATASRLEDFMYGTPLLPEARFAKIDLQKAMVRAIWTAAARAADAEGASEIDAARLGPALAAVLRLERTPQGDWWVSAPSGERTTISERDARQYGNVAYGLRAILAVQQDELVAAGTPLLPLAADAVEQLKRGIDLGTLAVLESADRAARLGDHERIDAEALRAAWGRWFGAAEGSAPAADPSVTSRTSPAAGPAAEAASAGRADFATTRAIVAEKLAAYAAYNQIAMPVFLRNIQVYFARYRWPTDPAEGDRFKNLFTEAMIAFAGDLLLEAEKEARTRGDRLVRVADVHAALQRFEPHDVNAYEDVVYFPHLPRDERITIEAYDLDAFRDSGLHWFYLEQAIAAPAFPGTLEPDPFAAELLTEGVAQFAGLVLRVSGEIAEAGGAPTLSTRDVEEALRRVQELLDRDAAAARRPDAESRALPSSGEPEAHVAEGKYFTVTTEAAGLSFEHRLADWLARLLRSYVQDRDGTVKLAVPQAFGGGGIAAEDIDDDGDFDLLILSGSGNALYLNDGRGHFEDVTEAAGLSWRRPDGRPGEPRQPIVADFDNDGRQDILITYVEDDHRLYRNLGDHHFADVTATAGLGGQGLVGGPAAALDYDGDGLIDLYIGYFGDYPRGVFPTLARKNVNGLPNKLFRNLGGMRFADVTAGSGTDNTGWAQAIGATDFDRDGRTDLVVGNDFGVNAWYRNLGGGKFEDVAHRLGTDKPSYTMNVGITDLNRDGFPEVYISNIVTMNKDEKYVLPDARTPVRLDPAKLATMRIVEANDLWMSRAEGGKLVGYELSNAVGRGASSTGWAWGADFFDFDNDGDDDLYCVNGMNEYAVYSSTNPYFTDASGQPRDVILPVYEKESNVFFVNRDGKLWNESAASGADWLGNSRSIAYLDADGDGDLDIAMNNFQGPAVFLRNNSERLGRRWLALRLIGDPARGVPRDAIGARIEVTSDHHAGLSREVRATTGYLSGHPKEQYLGLGDDPAAEVIVVWPNGERQQLGRLAADRRYLVTQGGATVERSRPESR